MRSLGAGREERIAALRQAQPRAGIARRARRRAGAAMVEAVIVLPVLLLTLFAVGFMRERYLGRQQASLAARRCAWAHAIGGCGQAPPGCSAAQRAAPEDDPDAVAIMNAAAANAGSSTIDVFEDIPVLGRAIAGLFGTQTGASAVSATALPWDRTTQVIDRSELVVLCNERPQDVLKAAQDVFCSHVPFVCAGD